MAPSPPRLRILSGWCIFLPPFGPLITSLHISINDEQRKTSFTLLPLCPLLSICLRSCLNSIALEKMDLLNICVVGGNAVSAFLSWRLQATNACDVTLVWKSGFDAVHQYGISFKYVEGKQFKHNQKLTGLADRLRLATKDSSLDMVCFPAYAII